MWPLWVVTAYLLDVQTMVFSLSYEGFAILRNCALEVTGAEIVTYKLNEVLL